MNASESSLVFSRDVHGTFIVDDQDTEVTWEFGDLDDMFDWLANKVTKLTPTSET